MLGTHALTAARAFALSSGFFKSRDKNSGDKTSSGGEPEEEGSRVEVCEGELLPLLVEDGGFLGSDRCTCEDSIFEKKST